MLLGQPYPNFHHSAVQWLLCGSVNLFEGVHKSLGRATTVVNNACSGKLASHVWPHIGTPLSCYWQALPRGSPITRRSMRDLPVVHVSPPKLSKLLFSIPSKQSSLLLIACSMSVRKQFPTTAQQSSHSSYPAVSACHTFAASAGSQWTGLLLNAQKASPLIF